ncbi:hypothetical protein Pan241w_31110 [Gimesia alba]|uniref:Uncharacterized protein n=1 Tax=Gimesia alba TaxID=2527973 RepID=A0A517RGL7_9PLAN|nr:hypothetical protein Pan241w_31110 [Gimesia alba]
MILFQNQYVQMLDYLIEEEALDQVSHTHDVDYVTHREQTLQEAIYKLYSTRQRKLAGAKEKPLCCQ